jgi:hypothetical protein
MPTDLRTDDRLEIAELIARLAHLLDEGRPDDIALVYTPDVVVHSPRGELQGLAEVIAFLRQSLRASQDEGEHTQHLHSNVLAEIDGDSASVRADQLVYYYRDGEQPHRISSLRPAYTAVRTPRGWRFSEVRFRLAWGVERS